MKSGKRTIIHADLDAFYASVEQRDHPEWRGRPVIIGGLERRGVVSTASYEARAFGVHSAQPGSTARRLCPQGIFVRPRMKAYVEASRQVFAIFERFTPQVEGLSLDEAFLDVTASLRLFGSARSIARQLREQVRKEVGLTISVGIASSKYVAKVASDLKKPDALVEVPPGDEQAFLAPLSLSCMWGAGPATRRKLEAVGLKTLGDLQRVDCDTLVHILGRSCGQRFFALARGEDPRDVISVRTPRSISREMTFAHDLEDDEALFSILLQLSEDVGLRLRRQELLGRVVRIKLRQPDFSTQVRQVQLDRGTQADMTIYRQGRQLLEQVRAPGQPVRLIGVGVTSLEKKDAAAQLELFHQEPAPAEEAVLETLDRIRERFGKLAISHGRPCPRPDSKGKPRP